MKKRQKITEKVGLALLILAGLAMVFLPLKTWAQDLDGDGILDDDEGVCLSRQELTVQFLQIN